ncbi:MAG: glycosyltransferase [Pedobacter sp.]|nr:MAG: glycosyltransferase [Pedobacter sp.]
MNILLTTHNYYPYNFGGTEVYVSNLALFLKNRGDQVQIIASVPDLAFEKNPTVYEDENLKVCTYIHEDINVLGVQYKFIDTTQIYSRQSYAHEKSWTAYLNKNKHLKNLDILHINGFTPTIGLDLIRAIHAVNKNLKIVTSYHTPISCAKENLMFANTAQEQIDCVDEIADMYSYRLDISYNKAKILSRLIPSFYIKYLPALFNLKYLTKSNIKSFKSLVSLTDEWWVYSNGIKNHLVKKNVSSEKIVAERHGISPLFINNDRISSSQNIFFFSGRMIKIKGIVTLLKAWMSLQVNPNRELWIASEPHSDVKKINDLISEAAQRKDIKWLGQLSQQEIAFCYSEASTVIIPSETYEIGPLVFHEAIASGCRVICSDIGGCKELSEHYQHDSTTFKTGNPEDLKYKIIELSSSPSKVGLRTKVLSFNEHFNNILHKSRVYEKQDYFSTYI